MKKILIFLFIILSGLLKAQNNGPLYRQFFFNPFTFNPAFAGQNNQTELGVVYRKQWVNFQDAPGTAGLTLQVPAGQRVVLGFNILSDKQVLMKNSSFMTSFIYVVPMGYQQNLRFGLSGGVGMNALNLSAEEMNTRDPVIVKAAGNNYYLNGNFGVVYRNRGLKLGFALTELFDSNPFSPERFNQFNFSNLKNRLYSASYRFDFSTVSSGIAIEPYFLYRESEDGLQNYWEAATLIHFNQVLWTGAGYNQDNGLALFLGLNVGDKFSFSYSYEFPPFKTSTFSASSHELQLNMRFGKQSIPASRPGILLKKYQRKRSQNFKRPGKNFPKRIASGRPAPAVRVAQPRTAKPLVVTGEEPARKDTLQVSVKPDSVARKTNHYVVVGSFQEKDHADNFVGQLIKQGYSPDIVINPENQNYNVYLLSTTDLEHARKFKDEYMQKPSFGKAWIMSTD